MRLFKISALAAFLSLCTMSGMVAFVSEANAQATCRAKCSEEEAACLKRTNNKSQCGGKASACMSKCK